MFGWDRFNTGTRARSALRHEAQYCAIFAVDIAGFGHAGRSDETRVAMRADLYGALRGAWRASGLRWTPDIHEDRGDGVLVAAPRVPAGRLIDPMLHRLRAELRSRNRSADPSRRIRLRAALHAGHLRRDRHGLVGASVNHVFRLLDAEPLRRALAEPGVDLAFMVSDEVYRNAAGAEGAIDPAEYSPVVVHVKETRTRGWLTIPATGRRPAVAAPGGDGRPGPVI
ncbi:hypothetical protein ACSNOI_29715 [Actinomadura kijaniata]|uniref:hypothetical protein n=1 Tax=Actinomadura kijaniata TaxID=46161 RepID=UPI003F1CFC0E